MTIKFYTFGNPEGGGGGTVIPAESDYGESESFEGTIGAAGATISFTRTTKGFTVRNTHDSNTMEFSIDGAVWHDLGPYAAMTLAAAENSVQLRPYGGGAGPVTYEVIGILSAI